MKKLVVIGLVLGLALAFGGVTVSADSLDQDSIVVNVSNPLYAEIRNLASSQELPPLVFANRAYQNSSIREYFDIVTNGDIDFTATITRPFRHLGNPDYWLRSLVYTRFSNGSQVHQHRFEFNDKEQPNWSSSQTALLLGPANYANMYMDIQASKYGADVYELMAGEYSTEIVLTVSAPLS